MISAPIGRGRCQLILDIESSEVVSLAMKLYGVEIRERAQWRAMISPSGSSAVISSSVRLEETDISSWEELLGAPIAYGVYQ
ncbi:hypothetical protein ACHAPJ_010942, partial [Fusarium lateritium]